MSAKPAAMESSGVAREPRSPMVTRYVQCFSNDMTILVTRWIFKFQVLKIAYLSLRGRVKLVPSAFTLGIQLSA